MTTSNTIDSIHIDSIDIWRTNICQYSRSTLGYGKTDNGITTNPYPSLTCMLAIQLIAMGLPLTCSIPDLSKRVVLCLENHVSLRRWKHH
jgi:hypothetical protein